jgi:hypothetical protein
MLGNFGYLIQFLLGIIAFMILIIKRKYEKPKRPIKVWLLDISKQIFSAGLSHILNIFLSVFLSDENNDECLFYFVCTFLDSTFGVFISFLFMKFLNFISFKTNLKIIQSGLYYEIIIQEGRKIFLLNLKMYFTQLFIWLIVTIFTKIIIILFQKFFNDYLNLFGNLFLNPYKNGKVKLIMVMVVFPLILDSFYFWITDNILKLNPDDDIKNFYNSFYEENDDMNKNENMNEVEIK